MGRRPDVFERIIEEFKTLIENGMLAFGEQLPTVRGYGVERRVNPNTVTRAYAALEEMGYIYVLPKKGAFVCYEKGAQGRKKYETYEQISSLKMAGISKEDLLAIIGEVYDRD